MTIKPDLAGYCEETRNIDTHMLNCFNMCVLKLIYIYTCHLIIKPINIIPCFDTDERGVLISFWVCFLLVADMPPAVVAVAAGLTAKARVSLSEPQITDAIRYLRAHPFMWLSGTDGYLRSKKEANECWTALGAMFGFTGEYHFFLFVIVGTGDVSLD